MRILKSTFSASLVALSALAFGQENIADMRENYNVGQTATVTGIVTNGPELGSIRYIQDETAGVAIYPGFDWDNLDFVPQPGDEITVTGEITEFANLLEIGPDISSMVLESSGNQLPQPFEVTPNELDETFEGMLVQISGAVFAAGGSTFSSSTFNYEASEETGIIYVPSSSPLQGELIPLGEIELIGILSQFSFADPFSGYQLLPRTAEDFISDSNINFGSEVEQTNLSTTSFTLSWSTDVASSSGVEYGPTPDYGTIVTLEEAVADHVVNLVDLEPGTPYFCRVFSVNGEDTASATGTFSTVSESSGDIAVYFNRSVDTSVSTGVDAISLFNATDDTIIAQIDRAMTTLDMAGYNINSGTIVQALNNALDRGVAIRYIAEGQTANTALANLDDAIPVLERQNSTSSGMHNKFIIVDRNNVDSALVLTGSTNFTTGNLFTDPNNLIIIKDQSLARAYTIEFEEMWGGSGQMPDPGNSRFGELKFKNTPEKFIIGGKNIELYFSPSDNTTTAIAEAIETTEYDLEFALLLITNNILADAIVDAANLFVQPRGLVNDVNGTGSDFQYLLDEGINVISHEGFGQLHHKYGIIDHSQPDADPIVITGSHNWTSSAESVNDENTLIIHDATIANLFHQEFTARYNEVTLSTNEVAQTELKLFPNPTSDRVTLQFEGGGSAATVSIFSLDGKMIKQLNITAFNGSNGLVLDVSSLPAGLYILQYNEGNRMGTQRLAISK
ncbi:phospholipase D-like domain-containing protein [Cryomorphaceae bacterium 1068]|nr:phospholipase D-like domain-containing protein [Cryomorphaceae bacterium 1068]